MSEIIKYDVFISHSFKDKDWVIEFTENLSDCGLAVFIFEKSIRVGESISKKINQVLEECECVILVLTPEWVVSEWSTLEAYSSLFLDPNNKSRKVIPLLLEDCTKPIIFQTLRHIDFREKSKFIENFNLLTSELSDLIQKRFIVHAYESQSEQILSQSMLPWTIHGGPSVGFIIPELYIDPKVKPIKNPLIETRFNSWLLSYKWNRNIAIVGLPGIGKSTLLKNLFINYKEYYNNLNLIFIPVFTTVRDVIDFQNTSSIIFSEYILSKLGIALPKQSNSKFLYLIDGLDEIEESSSGDIIEIIKSIISKNDLLWITCRKEFFFNRLKPDTTFYSMFYDVLEIQEWDIETDSLKFADDYSNKYNDREIYSRLVELRKKSENINNFLQKPFELTLILYLLSSKESISSKVFASSYSLYKSFYENWLQKEQLKGTSVLTTENIQKLHRIVAIALYNNRGNAINLGSIEDKTTDFDARSINIKSDSAFWDLLITTSNKKEDIIERFWHETFGEFILAEELIQSFCSPTQSFLENLKTIYHHEINLFIREGFQQLDKTQKEAVYVKLAKTYFAEFSISFQLELENIDESLIETLAIPITNINNSNNSIRIREQIVYYLGRLELSFYPPILSFAAKFETNLLLKRSAILGAILYRNEELERIYLEQLMPNSVEDKLNRSVQLVYFNDVIGDIHSFIDTSLSSWEKTRIAIFNRLRQNSNRDFALRWWDIRTLFCFFESRKWKDKISPSDFESIQNCICSSTFYSEERNNEVTKELSQVLDLLKINNCIIDN